MASIASTADATAKIRIGSRFCQQATKLARMRIERGCAAEDDQRRREDHGHEKRQQQEDGEQRIGRHIGWKRAGIGRALERRRDDPASTERQERAEREHVAGEVDAADSDERRRVTPKSGNEVAELQALASLQCAAPEQESAAERRGDEIQNQLAERRDRHQCERKKQPHRREHHPVERAPAE